MIGIALLCLIFRWMGQGGQAPRRDRVPGHRDVFAAEEGTSPEFLLWSFLPRVS